MHTEERDIAARAPRRSNTKAAAIKSSHERTIAAVKRKPSVGQGTSVTTARLLNGLACEITRGDWTLLADLGPGEGGDGSGPSPSVFGEGALAACLTMTIAIAAARRGIELTSLSVRVSSDWDLQGMYGLREDVPPGYTNVRIAVDMESSVSPDENDQLLAAAVANSPWVDVYRRGNDLTIDLESKG